MSKASQIKNAQNGDASYKNENWNDVVKYYSYIVNSPADEASSHVYAKLAIAQRLLKNYDESRNTLNQGIEKFPNNTNLLIEYAALENVEENWNKAVSLWEDASQLSTSFSVLNYKRFAKALGKTKNTKRLNLLLNKALEEHPGNSDLESVLSDTPKLQIAVQFYGHSRSFRDTFDSFKHFVIDANRKDQINIDVFIHTWDEKEHTTIKKHYKKDEEYAGVTLTESDIYFLKNNYNPIGLEIDSQLTLTPEQIEAIERKEYNKDNYNIINNISYTIHKANELRNRYNKTYDFVLMTRLDILFKKPLLFKDFIEDNIKPHMNFSTKELDKSIFYPYMDTPNLARNQMKYITGIDLLMLGTPKVLDTICSWHTNLFDNPPSGTENALTNIIKINNIGYHLLYYYKPQCWTILRTNTNNSITAPLTYNTTISGLLNDWNYNAAQLKYQESLKYNNNLIFEYFLFLADTGNLDILYDLITEYGFEYFKTLADLDPLNSSKGNSIKSMLNFYRNEFIPSSIGPITETEIASKLIYLSRLKTPNSLFSYLKENHSKIIIDSDGKHHMVLNFSINILISSRLLDTDLAQRIIAVYSTSKRINIQRKKYMVNTIIHYFHDIGHSLFFKYLHFPGGHLQKLSSIIHPFSSTEEGAVQLLRLLQHKIKSNSLSPLPYSSRYDKNIKVAVCISGVFRGNNLAINSCIENIIKPLNADVFIHTWNERHLWPGLGGDVNWVYRVFGADALSKCPKELKLLPFFESNFPSTSAKLKKHVTATMDESHLNKTIASNDFIIEQEDSIAESIDFPLDKLMSRGSLNQAKMFYGIYKCSQLMMENEEVTKSKYDYIIRCRPDVGLSNKLKLDSLTNLKDDEILVDFYEYGPQDQFRAGTRGSMLTLANIWESMIGSEALSPFSSYKSIDSHNLTNLWMINNNIIPIHTNVNRDISLVTKNMEIPCISNELETDLKSIDTKYKDRDDFVDFFNSLMKR